MTKYNITVTVDKDTMREYFDIEDDDFDIEEQLTEMFHSETSEVAGLTLVSVQCVKED